ncbi:DUF3742 family protein [Luteimonas sp. XNQY3]|nr:DUF3742 family protein [Luteimonas sp. XNQY3]MCD9007487.1 DUF3742 family protein [Luteimonas sp. XNQY3]
MTTDTHNARWPVRLGRRTGRVWGAYLRGEHQVARWLLARGWSSALAWGLLWSVKLVLLAALFYVAFWLALALALFLIAPYVGHALYAGTQWRYGPYGFGLYNDLDQRLDRPTFPEDEW